MCDPWTPPGRSVGQQRRPAICHHYRPVIRAITGAARLAPVDCLTLCHQNARRRVRPPLLPLPVLMELFEASPRPPLPLVSS